jgi:polyhydroxyalkanoate synthase
MHSQYLRRLFLNDDLSEGRYPVGGKPVSLGSLRLPTFMVGTLTDHVAPWRSVHKLHHLSPAEITFALTSGGHNAGIVNPPKPDSHRRYQLLTREAGGAYLAPDDWQAAAPMHAGSWWPAWQQWLAARSGAPVAPPRMGGGKFKPVDDAPGQYVLKK